MEDEIYTELVILSHKLTPGQLNMTLGIKCDESHMIGDLRKHTIIHEKENAWAIKSRLPRNAPLKEHITHLLERVSPITEKIKNIAEQPDVEVEFVCIIFTSNRPAMFFTKEQVATICAMGASIDIDLYLLPRRQKKVTNKTDPV